MSHKSSAGHRALGTILGKSEIPSLPRRGGRDTKKDAAKPPLMERTGWLIHAYGVGATTPSAPLRWLRDIILMAQPPLLGKEGCSLRTTGCSLFGFSRQCLVRFP